VSITHKLFVVNPLFDINNVSCEVNLITDDGVIVGVIEFVGVLVGVVEFVGVIVGVIVGVCEMVGVTDCVTV
jgi:hypothetical protein